jgi:apolipoprotein N-acyltransferase
MLPPTGIVMRTTSTLLSLRQHQTLCWALGAIIAFHIASTWPTLSALMVVFFFCLIKASQEGCGRMNFYLGLIIGMGTYSWHLRFFTNIFSGAAFILWLVLALWVGIFMMLASHYQRRRSTLWQIVLLTCAWMSLEYFRGELYFLKFTWATPGLAFSSLPGTSLLGSMGVYGISGLCVALASLSLFFSIKNQLLWLTGATLGLGWIAHSQFEEKITSVESATQINVGGLHLENPGSLSGLKALDQYMADHPDTDLIVLAEYSFFGPPPQSLLDWCQSHKIHMVAGGTQALENDTYFNTAFVISPEGKVIFKQVKSVPIQFFNDGLPALHQQIWQSPWGAIGICICYDLSYTRVIDKLIRQGAHMIMVPTLDELHWGESQHKLHARVAPMRAAEYQVSIVRVGACGISQAVDINGSVIASTQFPGKEGTIYAKLQIPTSNRTPWDRYLIWICFGIVVFDLLRHFAEGMQRKSIQGNGHSLESDRADSR